MHRGFRRYAAITVRELFTYKPDYHTIVTDGRTLRSRALHRHRQRATARQRRTDCPEARLDDGRLDVVVVSARSPLAALVQVPRVFSGRIATCRA